MSDSAPPSPRCQAGQISDPLAPRCGSPVVSRSTGSGGTPASEMQTRGSGRCTECASRLTLGPQVPPPARDSVTIVAERSRSLDLLPGAVLEVPSCTRLTPRRAWSRSLGERLSALRLWASPHRRGRTPSRPPSSSTNLRHGPRSTASSHERTGATKRACVDLAPP